MFGQFPWAAPLPAVPEGAVGAVVDEVPSVVELEPEPLVVVEDEPEVSLVCA